ncbi:hypothetical protein HNQ80_000820 [Anaerosolibacter carboniphilus]|uniref:Spo0E like sporulation regulatory protein n=1 Tax=Anaerosolibacter carboniphilus TaxID=1417629 RepID=A0A841KMR7_9FIRM|nr:aspartyl-phosphate phosphatase Spo0E family protein [Anaerosolibacter carboniphilus]MBB6214737.1 hypothetical protein [Anaerosolibacter carboniphilus]
MDSLEKISFEIEEIRVTMHELISKDPALIDPKILVISQELDMKINEFNEILRKKG